VSNLVSDSSGNFPSVDLPITDDWVVGEHMITAKDAREYQTSKTVVVLAAPVITITSQYQTGAMPIGSQISLSGERFAPKSKITLLLDRAQLDVQAPLSSNDKGQVDGQVTVGANWTKGLHYLRASDEKGNVTRRAVKIYVSHRPRRGMGIKLPKLPPLRKGWIRKGWKFYLPLAILLVVAVVLALIVPPIIRKTSRPPIAHSLCTPSVTLAHTPTPTSIPSPTSTPSLYQHFRPPFSQPIGLLSLSGKLNISGGTALGPVLIKIGCAYNQQYQGQGVLTINVKGGGSIKGLQDAQDGVSDIGVSGLFVEQVEKDPYYADLIDYQVAVVIFAVIVNDDVGITNITPDLLQDIYTGKVTNWSQVGGNNLNIVAYNRDADSGTRETLEHYVLGEPISITTPSPVSDTQTMVKQVSETHGAIGYAALHDATNALPHVKIVPINNSEPNNDDVKNGTYPFWTIEHLYTKGLASGLTQAFIDYVGSPSGTLILVANSFVDINSIPCPVLNSRDSDKISIRPDVLKPYAQFHQKKGASEICP